MSINVRSRLLLATMCALAPLLVFIAMVNADSIGQETSLNPDGMAYEINTGPHGNLWISDNSTGEIWALDEARDAYTIYRGTAEVSDARQAPDDSVWWVDQTDNSLGRLHPETGEATHWEIPGALTLSGTAIDAEGNIWLSQYFDPEIYRFVVESGQICTYTLASDGGSDYILAQGTEIWLADWINDRIRRLDAATGELTSWALPPVPGLSHRPEGLAVDGASSFWWADIDRHHLARLEPDLDRLTTYELPYGSRPHMITASGSQVWYTEGRQGTVGRLDPDEAEGSATSVTRETTTLIPTCATLTPTSTDTLAMTTGAAEWVTLTYTTIVDSEGWLIYQLPSDAYPWGVASSDGYVWVVDNGRQVLAHVEDPHDDTVRVYLPLTLRQG